MSAQQIHEHNPSVELTTAWAFIPVATRNEPTHPSETETRTRSVWDARALATAAFGAALIAVGVLVL